MTLWDKAKNSDNKIIEGKMPPFDKIVLYFIILLCAIVF
jgi:hypothetical protein